MLLPVRAVVFGILASVSTRGRSTPEQPHPSALIAAPVSPRKTFITPHGPLVYYGWPTENDNDAPSAANTTASGVQKRCGGSNAVHCDSSNVPDALACRTLIYDQGLQQDNTEIPECVGAHCLTVNGQQCCISWSAKVPGGLQRRSLFNGASDAYHGCVEHGASGATSDTNLSGVCLVQCLSNRPEGCA